MLALTLLFILRLIIQAVSLNCNLNGIDEVRFAGTPIWKAFNKTTSRPECIIGCIRYPSCQLQQKPKTNDDIDLESDFCKNFKGNRYTTYMKGPGWSLSENRERRDGEDTCPSLPTCAQGFEVVKCRGKVCLTMQTDCICSRYATDQTCAKVVAPASCAQIKKEKPSAASGMYYVELHLNNEKPKKLFRVYCDMENGGWMAVSNLTIKGISTADAKTKRNYARSDYLLILSKITNGDSSLSPDSLVKLMAYNNFTQVRFVCKKESVDRIIDIATTPDENGKAVVDYFFNDGPRPVFCNSYMRMPSDNSLLAGDCENVIDGMWSSSGAAMEPKYKFVMFPVGTDDHSFSVGNLNEWECDDKDTGQSIDGNWMHFVR